MCFFFNKIGEQEQEGGTVSAGGRDGQEVSQIMNTHVSKCKNN
jgi:hypothetical protein